MYLEWLRMFAKPTADAGMSQGDILRKAGVDVAIRHPRFDFNVDFDLSSTAPAAKLVGFIKNETVENAVWNGPDTEECTRATEHQTEKFVNTEKKSDSQTDRASAWEKVSQ